MQEVFDKLRKLQEILLEEFEIEEELEEIPRELNGLKTKYHRIERTIIEKETVKEKNETMIGQVRSEKEELMRNREKYEGQIPLIKTA